MRRWDGLAENYHRACEIRGLAEGTTERISGELDRWGCWLKRRKPKPKIEEITSDQIIKYIASRAVCRSRSTIYGTISIMRGMGDFLVSEGFWRQNPLKWIRGPKLDPRHRLPRRIEKEHMKKIWIEVANIKSEYQRGLWTLVLGLLYGIGIRRGELERLKVSDWDYNTGLLKVDGRKTGRERYVPLPEVA